MSIDSSSEHLSFENLGQSTDSGYPLLSSTDSSNSYYSNKQQNPSLSQVLGADIGSPGCKTLLSRSPSDRSVKLAYLQRRHLNTKAESIASETSSTHHHQQHYQQRQQHHLNHKHKHKHMASESAHSNGTPTALPAGNYSGSTPRSSMYSDQAVFTVSRQRGETESILGSSPPDSFGPSTPPAVHSAQPGAWRQQHQQFTPASTLTPTPQRPQSIVVLSSPALSASHTSFQQQQQQQQQHWGSDFNPPERRRSLGIAAAGGEPGNNGNHNGCNNTDNSTNGTYGSTNALGHKTYALPAVDTAPQNALEFSQALRIRIERDYSSGDARQFALEFPEQLRGKIDEQRFKRFVRRVNGMLAEAEGATLRNVLEGILAYATLYISTLFIKPNFGRTVNRISSFIAEENEALFKPAGFTVIDPKQTAFMFIEIIML
ncbi:Golgin sub A member 7 [Dipsacomyces acuminosporus]|nr:Golgin sub A member 7 [Dipsacomyces acuminosporus]